VGDAAYVACDDGLGVGERRWTWLWSRRGGGEEKRGGCVGRLGLHSAVLRLDPLEVPPGGCCRVCSVQRLLGVAGCAACTSVGAACVGAGVETHLHLTDEDAGQLRVAGGAAGGGGWRGKPARVWVEARVGTQQQACAHCSS